jgi:integrase
MPFSQFNSVQMKKFVALMKGKKKKNGKSISAKRIQNVMIPLRVIVKDAIEEHGWINFPDPFSNCKLPRPKKYRVQPFSFDEWNILINRIPEWYRPYFEFAVQTGLRPSEQVALKWGVIDEEYIHIELSRVRNHEKEDLKTHESRRRILLRPTLKHILEQQRELTKEVQSPYVFINTFGRPILQDKLRELWSRVICKTSLTYRRMYETRHTFASWALALGETPEWVARTLGHVDTSMVYKTYGRYIPNLTKMDGSAFESQFSGSQNSKGNQAGHNCGHNRDLPGCQ